MKKAFLGFVLMASTLALVGCADLMNSVKDFQED